MWTKIAIDFQFSVIKLALSDEGYPHQRQTKELRDRVDDNAGDIQYILQTFAEFEDRLARIEDSAGQQGKDSIRHEAKSFVSCFVLLCDLPGGRDERTRVSDVCPGPCPRFSDMPLSESVSEVMTLSESMSESVSEVQKNLVSVSEPTSEIEIFYLSESVSESMSELMSEPMSVSASEPLSESNQVQSGRSQAVKGGGRAIMDDPSKSGRS